MGRPRVSVEPEQIGQFSKTGATQKEIALRLGISLATLERLLQQPKFRSALDNGRAEMLISLRAKQVQVALSGNVQMLRWLGEQYLDQASNHRVVDKEGKDRPIVDASPIELINARIISVLERKRESGGSGGS